MSRRTFPILITLLLTACGPSVTPTPTLQPSATPTPEAEVVHSTLKFQVFILETLTTCLVGNEFASGTVCAGTACGDCDCSWEQHDPRAPQVGVAPEHIDDPEYAGYEFKVCVDVSLTRQEIADIIADMELVREQATVWTGGALDLKMVYTVLSHTHTGFTAPEFVIGPFEIDDELLNDYVDTDTDLVYVVSGVSDRERGLQLSYWCGGAYGELSIHGASYAYIQYNHEVCNSVMIAGESVYEPLMHEWIHSLDWMLYYVNQVPDLYQEASPDWQAWDHASWPACREGSPDPLDWFPSIDFCEWDPDWIDCNSTRASIGCQSGEVDGAISWYEHVLSTHFPRNLELIGNFCRDGRQDFGESGVDSGWPCP